MKHPRIPARGLLLATAAFVCQFAVAACAQESAPPAAAASTPTDSILARAQQGRLKGAANAPVTIVEVSDFQCPYCRQFTESAYPKLDSAYIRTGKVRLLYINFPLSSHLQAFAAAEAAACAGAQGQFWAMHDRLFATQREWNGAADAGRRFEGFAEALRLDMPAFRDCTANDRTASLIVGDVMEASGGGVNGTPSFFMSGPGGRKPLAGNVPWEVMQREIEALLVAAPAAPAPQPAPPPNPQN